MVVWSPSLQTNYALRQLLVSVNVLILIQLATYVKFLLVTKHMYLMILSCVRLTPAVIYDVSCNCQRHIENFLNLIKIILNVEVR